MRSSKAVLLTRKLRSRLGMNMLKHTCSSTAAQGQTLRVSQILTAFALHAKMTPHTCECVTSKHARLHLACTCVCTCTAKHNAPN
jgi:hypothetical protein